MIDAPLGFAFSAGTVAAFNPCGFALLPAYLSLFLGADEGRSSLRRAVVVAGAVTAGFAAVFGVAGLVITRTAVTVQEITPWLSVGIGLALVPVGVALTRGWQPKLSIPRLNRGGRDGSVTSMVWFGASYATVSLSCTIPPFLVSVATTFESEDVLSGVVVFASYTAGMAAVLALVTVAIATARRGLVSGLRRVQRFLPVVTGVLTIVAGLYVAYYGWYEIQLERGNTVPTGPIDTVGEWSGDVTRWVDDLGNTVIAVAAGLLVGAMLVVGLVRRRRGRVATGRA